MNAIKSMFNIFSYSYWASWFSIDSWKTFPKAYFPFRLYSPAIAKCGEGGFTKVILWIVYFFLTGWLDLFNNIIYYYLYVNDAVFDLLEYDPEEHTTISPDATTAGSYFSYIG